MQEKDLILDGGYSPTFDEITRYIGETRRNLWEDLNGFIQRHYQVLPKLAFSKCSAKPGWNVKYQKSGKSLCTLYPEKDYFTILIVVGLDLVPIIKGSTEPFEISTLEVMRAAKPFNGTLWLMIPIGNQSLLEDAKRLLELKYNFRR